jgi:hypothetical protein
MQELHSRKGKGLDVTVTDQAGQKKVTTRHRSQEGLIDEAVERSKAGKLTPQGQLDAAAEVKWRTTNVPMDQRDVDAIRKGGPAPPEKGPPIDPKTGRVNSIPSKTKKVVETTAAGGKQLAKRVGKTAASAIPFVGIGVGLAAAADNFSEGNYVSGALDLVGLVPVVGDIVDITRTVGELAVYAAKALRKSPGSVLAPMPGALVFRGGYRGLLRYSGQR